jgi:hypothetical protein
MMHQCYGDESGVAGRKTGGAAPQLPLHMNAAYIYLGITRAR